MRITSMQKIEVIVRITKDHCLPQEQTIFEWIETNRAAPDTLNYPGLEINLEHRRVFKNGQEVRRMVGVTSKEELKDALK